MRVDNPRRAAPARTCTRKGRDADPTPRGTARARLRPHQALAAVQGAHLLAPPTRHIARHKAHRSRLRAAAGSILPESGGRHTTSGAGPCVSLQTGRIPEARPPLTVCRPRPPSRGGPQPAVRRRPRPPSPPTPARGAASPESPSRARVSARAAPRPPAATSRSPQPSRRREVRLSASGPPAPDTPS